MLVEILTVNIRGRPSIAGKALNEVLRRAQARRWMSLIRHEVVVRET